MHVCAVVSVCVCVTAPLQDQLLWGNEGVSKCLFNPRVCVTTVCCQLFFPTLLYEKCIHTITTHTTTTTYNVPPSSSPPALSGGRDREEEARNSVLLHHHNPWYYVHPNQNSCIQPASHSRGSPRKRRLVGLLAITRRIEPWTGTRARGERGCGGGGGMKARVDWADGKRRGGVAGGNRWPACLVMVLVISGDLGRCLAGWISAVLH